jgi:hypothetical protein
MQGKNVLGNGMWLNVGDNQAVTYGGAEAENHSHPKVIHSYANLTRARIA